MEETIGAPQQGATSLLESAVRYAEERHWDVCPGTWLVEGDGPPRCSCANLTCPSPGAHPSRPDWAGQASGNPMAVQRMWSAEPRASIVMPTGYTFDVIDVPEVAGCLALARMERTGIQLGPVACTPDRRLQFFVMPGASTKVPELVRRLGWVSASLDIVCRGAGDYVLAPPTRVAGQGSVLWARPPTALNRWLPEAEELINPVAYACGREAAAARRARAAAAARPS